MSLSVILKMKMMNFLHKYIPSFRKRKTGTHIDSVHVRRRVDAQIGRAITRLSER